jgi:hypothetical protein
MNSNATRHISDEISNLYFDIKSKIKDSNDSIQSDEREKFKSLNLKTIINYLKESIEILIEKTWEDSQQKLKNELSKKSKTVEEEFLEQNDYEKIICKLESEIRNHIKIQYQMKLHSESMEFKLQDLESVLADYEDLQKKVEMYESKMMVDDYSSQTDKKENEILILKSENSNLKNIIKNLEQKLINAQNDDTRIDELKKQHEYEQSKNNEIIESLSNKVRAYAKMLKTSNLENSLPSHRIQRNILIRRNDSCEMFTVSIYLSLARSN